jgi:hypothetical protein
MDKSSLLVKAGTPSQLSEMNFEEFEFSVQENLKKIFFA